MNLFQGLKRPFARHVDKLRDKFHGFVDPIQNGISTLRGKLPGSREIAGSESAVNKNTEGQASSRKLGLLERLKSFKKSLNEMSDFQKIILLAIAVCLPAGILIATILVKFLKSR